MDQQKFALWVLILTVGMLQWYYTVDRHFGGEAQMRVQVEKLQAQLEQEKLQHALAKQELREFKQHVATLIPELETEDQQTYPVRNLASVVVTPDLDKIKIEKGSTLFERAKRKFKEGDYQQANRTFSTLIQKYPDSTYVPEAYFLSVEGSYKAGEYEECLKKIDNMVTLFPENDLTGFALIRMGEVLASRDRIEDAEQIYRTILENFKNDTLIEQANRNLKDIVL